MKLRFVARKGKKGGVGTWIRWLDGDKKRIGQTEREWLDFGPERGNEFIRNVEPPAGTAYMRIGARVVHETELEPLKVYLDDELIATFPSLEPDEWQWTGPIDIRAFWQKPMVQAGLGIVGVTVVTGIIGKLLDWW